MIHNRHKNPHLQNSWNKYGADSFNFEILELVKDPRELIVREQYWMDQLNVIELGYNIKPKAGSNLGYKMSQETKNKLRKKALGRKATLETRMKYSLARKGSKNNMYGKNHSEESIKKMSENRGDARGEKNSFFGKHHTQETKDIISKMNIGRVVSDEERLMRSVINSGERNPFYGKKHSQETIEKIKDGYSQERRNTISERMKLNNPNKNGTLMIKGVSMLDKDTNEVIKTFKSGTDAGNYIKSLNLTKGKTPNTAICEVCRGQQITAYGYKWKFTNNVEQNI